MPRLRLAGPAITLAVVVGLSGCAGAGAPESAVRDAPPAPTAAPSIPPPPPAPAPAAPAPPPVGVAVPAIALEAPLIDLGIEPDGTMEVPSDFDEVGWFTGGGRPGGSGPTVIAAHVDSPTGPAAFIDLDRVAVGDAVTVTDAEGTAHDYVVTRVEQYPKDAFPTAEVFGASARDELRLITCTGVFDPDAASYVDNLVVYAERAGQAP
ncbi:class F sortase [Microcella daejeonensis]|uniref:Class F sortase n=1 Tax=Microcella daejeonensis TaxID=2994971 RepID=A0A9E8MIY5_9MICO|nr:class F sortase [Microcella daejeonensis]WAB80424.1 class F sortase [Microcella daejeonensis]